MDIFNLLFSTVLGFSSISATAPAPVQVVEKVDLNRYQGDWYEIAAIPQFFQRNCIKDTVANYTLDPKSDYVIVINKCTTKDDSVSIAEGRAKVVDPVTNAKLKVTFVKLFDWIFTIGGDYWVIGLEKDYKWAVIGNPNHKYAWILSRDKFLSPADLKIASDILIKNGYDTCKLLTSVQAGGFSERNPLCNTVK